MMLWNKEKYLQEEKSTVNEAVEMCKRRDEAQKKELKVL